MSRKNLIKSHKMLDSVDISTNQTSDKSSVEPVDTASIIIEWAGTAPVGTITVEVSNSTDNEFRKTTETWLELDFASAINISGASGDHQILLTELPFRYIRIKYNSTSGTGSLTANLQATTLGA